MIKLRSCQESFSVLRMIPKQLSIFPFLQRLLLFGTLHLFAISSVYAQTITISVRDAPLRNVMKSIRSQTGYAFLLRSDLLKHANPVTAHLEKATLENTLNTIFKNQPFYYRIENKNIIIQPKDPAGKAPQKVLLETETTYRISGFVTDPNDRPIPGATVRVKSGTTGVVTDATGAFNLEVPPGQTILINSIGFISEEFKPKNTTNLKIVLQEYIGKLQETVVKGYYTTTKALNTGTVNSIKGIDLSKQPVSDPLMAMEGRIPGLYISQNSGVPGSSLNVRLRGQNSISNGNSPLYIVNGIPISSNSLSLNSSAAVSISPLAGINPQDIESIDVLKDADATAIYGSRGANGVVIITTKKGTQGKTKVDIDLSTGFGQVARKLKLLNTSQYISMRKEAIANDGAAISTTDYDINGTWKNGYSDWQKMMIGGTAHLTNASISISGGNDLTQFLIAGGYRRESTVYPGDNKDRKASFNINLNHTSANKRFSTTFSGIYVFYKNELPATDFSQSIFIAPNSPAIYTPDGQLNWENQTFNNPFAALNIKSSSITRNLIGSFNLSYKIFDGLVLKSTLGYNNNMLKDGVLTPFTAYNPILLPYASSLRSNQFGTNEINNWHIEPQLSYSKKLNHHSIEALIGGTFQMSHQESLNNYTSGYASDGILNNPLAAATKNIVFADDINYRYNAIMARLGYNYNQKYIVNFTGRRDGSSRFGPGRQFGNFGAVGVGWVFSQEPFFSQLLPYINYGKIRGSVGTTGNDQLPDYQYLSTYTSSGYTYGGVSTLNPTSLSNPNFGWETIKKKELGLELALLNSRIQLNVNWYNNQTGNQLVGYTLPYTTGFSTVQANLPAIIKNTGWELDITSTNLANNQFTWTSAFNISFPRNQLVSYPNIESSAYKHLYAIGYPLTIRYLYAYNGIDQQTGLFSFKDLNKDGQVTFDDDQYPVFIGQKYFGGLNNSFTYKGFTLDIFIQFVKQTGYSFTYYGIPGFINQNQPTAVINRWQKPGDNAVFQKYTADYGSAATSAVIDFYGNSDARITDASFIRLKNVMLSWNLPEKWLNQIKFQRMQLFIQGQNLFTITKFDGLDPENGRSDGTIALPPLRMINGGLKITL